MKKTSRMFGDSILKVQQALGGGGQLVDTRIEIIFDHHFPGGRHITLFRPEEILWLADVLAKRAEEIKKAILKRGR